MIKKNPFYQTLLLIRPYLILTLLVGSVWVWSYGKTTAESWQYPVVYSGDQILGYGMIRAFMDGDVVLFGSKTVARLNAPGVANWNDWPVTEDVLLETTGLIARFTGLFAASDLILLIGSVFTAWTFYFSARQLGSAVPMAFSGGLILAFCPYVNQQLAWGHLTLALIWPIPLMILSLFWLASGKIPVETWQTWLMVVLAVFVGWSQQYYSFMYCQLVGFTVISNLFCVEKKKVKLGLLVIGVVVLAFISTNYETFWYALLHGRNGDVVARNLAGAELYGLKIADFFAGGLLSWWARIYYAHSMIAGERSGYFGVVSLLALAWLTLESIFFVLQKKANQLTLFSPLAGWVFLYSVVGEVNHLLASVGFQVFRATNRYSIFLQVIALLFLAVRLSQQIKNPKLYGVALLLLLIGAVDQLQKMPNQTQSLVLEDQALSVAMEQTLPTGGMVFQLPVMAFPEVPPHPGSHGGVPDYDHFRPYLFTDRLRFSYGTNKGRGEEIWQFEVEKLPVEKMIEALQNRGFSGLYINRNGYADFGQKLLRQLKQLGYRQIKPTKPNRSSVAFVIQALSNPSQ